MEMEEKALDRILASVRLIGCDNWCVIHHMRDALMDDFSFIMQYRLAGRDARTIYHRIPAYRLSPLGSHERIEQICTALVEALSKDIAAQMLAPAMQKTLSEIQTRW